MGTVVGAGGGRDRSRFNSDNTDQPSSSSSSPSYVISTRYSQHTVIAPAATGGLRFSAEPVDLIVQRGAVDVVLNCTGMDGDSPATVAWRRVGAVYDDQDGVTGASNGRGGGGGHREVLPDGRLKIARMSRADVGLYECLAESRRRGGVLVSRRASVEMAGQFQLII